MDGQALYYGMNALSNNVIMADRKKLKSANGREVLTDCIASQVALHRLYGGVGWHEHAAV